MLLPSLYNDYQLAAEQFHGGLSERLQRGSIAVADSTERTRSLHLEAQLVGSIGNECAVLVDQ